MVDRRTWGGEPTVPAPRAGARPADVAGSGPTWPVSQQRPDKPYRPGVASVGPRAEPTAPIVDPTIVGPGWTAGQPRPPLRYQIRQLKKGSSWSKLGGLFAFVCWGIWTISERGGSLVVPLVAFVLVLNVAVGVFALSRLIGRLVLERHFGRIRRSAWPSHLVTGVFLAAAGVQYLRQTEWVVSGLSWLRGLGY